MKKESDFLSVNTYSVNEAGSDCSSDKCPLCLQGVWFPCPLHRCVQHESSGQAKAAWTLLERPRHQAPLCPAQGVLRLQLVTHTHHQLSLSLCLTHTHTHTLQQYTASTWRLDDTDDRTYTHKHTHAVKDCFPRSRVDHWLTLVPLVLPCWFTPTHTHTHTHIHTGAGSLYCICSHTNFLSDLETGVFWLYCVIAAGVPNLQGAQKRQRCPDFLFLITLKTSTHQRIPLTLNCIHA